MHRLAGLMMAATLAILVTIGCSRAPEERTPNYSYGVPEFSDVAETNVSVNPDDFDLTFVDLSGNQVSLRDFRGKKNLVLVFTRGLSGRGQTVCPLCTAQTSRLAAQYAEFAQRDAQVLVVFPGEKATVSKFLSSVSSEPSQAATPFPIVLDEQFDAVDRLGIRGDQAKPSTYILDKHGAVRFAYVGAHVGDRPSVKAILAQLDAMQAGGEEAASPAEVR